MTFLAGKRILIVEDEFLLAIDLGQILEEWGVGIVGPVPNIDQALELIAEERPHAVTLDMNLGGVSSLPLATELVIRSIPFVVISGYSDSSARSPALCDVPFVRKPYSESALLTALTSVLR
jgi:DNA-binding NtrC family response regulator